MEDETTVRGKLWLTRETPVPGAPKRGQTAGNLHDHDVFFCYIALEFIAEDRNLKRFSGTAAWRTCGQDNNERLTLKYKMATSQHNKISKFLSYILRHKPESIGLTLDEQGWANIDELIDKANRSNNGPTLDQAIVQAVVSTNDKKRFIISEDGQNIRAAQGHSIDVDLQLKPIQPPEFLYHGTATRFLDSILKEGLKPQQRQYVHLSKDAETATAVGQRYGKPVILTINALLMHEHGFMFYLSENGVWLTERVPITFIND